MTFERLYSIVWPHKAASFNTVKRAEITLLCCSIFGILYDIPHYVHNQFGQEAVRSSW